MIKFLKIIFPGSYCNDIISYYCEVCVIQITKIMQVLKVYLSQMYKKITFSQTFFKKRKDYNLRKLPFKTAVQSQLRMQSLLRKMLKKKCKMQVT